MSALLTKSIVRVVDINALGTISRDSLRTNALSLGSLTGDNTWAENMGVNGTTGTITTNGSIIATGNIFTTSGNISATTGSISGRDISSSTTITATGNITGPIGTFKYIACTATSGRPITPSG